MEAVVEFLSVVLYLVFLALSLCGIPALGAILGTYNGRLYCELLDSRGAPVFIGLAGGLVVYLVTYGASIAAAWYSAYYAIDFVHAIRGIEGDAWEHLVKARPIVGWLAPVIGILVPLIVWVTRLNWVHPSDFKRG